MKNTSKFYFSKINIPFDKLQYNFSRSSGPGGQNVNKLNTKVELRMNLNSDWLPTNIRQRLEELYRNRINKEGELVIFSQESRNQIENKFSVEEKLKKIIEECSQPKVVSNFIQKPETINEKDNRIMLKKMKSDVKKIRMNKYI